MKLPHGVSPAQALESLMAQLEASQAETAAYRRAYAEASLPTLRRVIVGLDELADQAENPRHPGQLNARKLLEAWAEANRHAARVLAGIAMADRMPDPSNGST